VDVSLD